MKNKLIIFLILIFSIIISFFLWYNLKINHENKIINKNISIPIENIISKNIDWVVSIIWENDLEVYNKNPIWFINNNYLNKKASWFFINNNWLIITNKHILNKISNNYIIITNDNKRYKSKKIYIFDNIDIALIQIETKIYKKLNITNWQYYIWEDILAIWNIYWELWNSISKWIISWIDREISDLNLKWLIQTDLKLYPWNSWWPLINNKWKVIWINTAILNNYKNIGFAIPINQKYIDSLIKKSGL